MVNYMKNFNFQKYGKGITKCTSPCPDQYFADLINGQLVIRTRENIDYYEKKGTKGTNLVREAKGAKGTELDNIIVIVLESPHKDEFDKNGLPLGPAMGKTGDFFIRRKKGFVDFISDSGNCSILKEKYQLVYVNSVQYQTSLGMSLNLNPNKNNRDNIWLSIFNKDGGDTDLKKRIEALKPQLVINLCTKGLKNLQLYVDNTISVSSYKYTFGTHPSTWNFSYAYIK